MPTISQLLKVLDLDPSDPVTHFSLANLYRDEKDIPNAIAHYRQSTTLKPDYSAAWFEMAKIAESDRQWAVAREAYEGAMRASGSTGDDHILKAAAVRIRKLESRSE
jgi:Tfp pilus assembly protein PilF